MKANILKYTGKAGFSILLLLLISGFGISQTKWTKVVYYYNVGSLPPPYHYEYTITINSDGTSELVYMMGYTRTFDNTLEYSLDVRNTAFKNLKKEIKESKLLNKRVGYMPSEKIPVGGSSEHLVIYDGEDTLTYVPSYPEMKYETVLEELYSKIRKCIPDDVWNEVKAKREERMDYR